MAESPIKCKTEDNKYFTTKLFLFRFDCCDRYRKSEKWMFVITQARRVKTGNWKKRSISAERLFFRSIVIRVSCGFSGECRDQFFAHVILSLTSILRCKRDQGRLRLHVRLHGCLLSLKYVNGQSLHFVLFTIPVLWSSRCDLSFGLLKIWPSSVRHCLNAVRMLNFWALDQPCPRHPALTE